MHLKCHFTVKFLSTVGTDISLGLGLWSINIGDIDAVINAVVTSIDYDIIIVPYLSMMLTCDVNHDVTPRMQLS